VAHEALSATIDSRVPPAASISVGRATAAVRSTAAPEAFGLTSIAADPVHGGDVDRHPALSFLDSAGVPADRPS
jgi:hypothetical protein